MVCVNDNRAVFGDNITNFGDGRTSVGSLISSYSVVQLFSSEFLVLSFQFFRAGLPIKLWPPDKQNAGPGNLQTEQLTNQLSRHRPLTALGMVTGNNSP
jgi:hypothetical protein